MKPTQSFRAVVPGSAYPQTFTPDDDLSDDAAAVAHALGHLSEEDAKALEAAQDKAAKDAAAAAKKEAKAQAAAPENKAGGADS
jgi:hypothetical protein